LSVEAATDVSGFGLVGHLLEMAQTLGAEIKIRSSQVLGLGGYETVERAGVASFLTRKNRDQFSKQVAGGPDLAFDPQTNGPLILAIQPKDIPQLLFELSENGFPSARHIGDVGEKATGGARVVFSS
jgi:selenide,water dikinase